MNGFQPDNIADRLNTAAQAKKALLERAFLLSA
jgi:hypothetical protein